VRDYDAGRLQKESSSAASTTPPTAASANRLDLGEP